MSNYLSVATITAAFGKLLTDALQAVPNLSAQPELRIGRPPPDSPGSFVGANLFLYRATPSAVRRNNNPATHSAGSASLRPQIAIDLDYIVTFYGSDLSLEPHRLMGSVIALMQAHPVLSAVEIRAVVGSGGPQGPLAGADLDLQAEPVRFTPNPLDLDNLHRLWSLFPGAPYAPSFAYTAPGILIEDVPAPARAPARTVR